MDNATQLQDNGIAPTDKRVEIFSIFTSSSIPLSATAILRKIGERKIHRATVFRTVQLFEEKGIIRRVDFMEGEYRYELASLPHHHFALCRTCGATERIDICMAKDEIRHIKKQIGFRVIDHSLVFYGVCKKCSELI